MSWSRWPIPLSSVSDVEVTSVETDNIDMPPAPKDLSETYLLQGEKIVPPDNEQILKKRKKKAKKINMKINK